MVISTENRAAFSGRPVRRFCSLGLLGALLLPPLAGCGGLRAASSLEKQDSGWSKLTIGKKVSVYADASCTERFSTDRAELERGGGVSLGAVAWAQSAATYEIVESYGAERGPSGPKGGAYLKLSGNGQNAWVFAESGFSCVFPAEAALTADVLAQKGKSYAFTPWAQKCKRITGSGKGFAAVAQTIELPPATVVDSIRLTAGGVRYSLGGGQYVVDRSTLDTCFAPPGTVPRSEFDYLANIKIEPSRCEASTFQGKTLVECRSTVGVWQANDDGLTLARRTLGPLYFLDGQPVTGSRFARSVVAVTTASPENDRQRALYRGIDAAVQRAVAATDASIRVAPPSDPGITMRVRLSIADITIGDIVRRETSETTKFKIRDSVVPNPDKIKARGQMQELEKKYADANTRCRSQGGSDCRKKLAEIGDLMKVARETFAKIPETTTSAVYGDWKYTKTIYARTISATIATETSDGTLGTKRNEEKVSFEDADYEIVADPAHGVAGHAVDRELLVRPDSRLPRLAERAGEVAANALRRTMQRGAFESAVKAFKNAGGSSQPGFERVDAAAFDAVGDRLQAGEAFGEGTGAIAAPAAVLAANECLLVAAVASAEGGKVSITAGVYADERGKDTATLEICRNELGDEALPAITLGGKARWAIYKSEGVAAAAAVKPAP